ncbi:tyrosine-type recombinase/integrase [Candidatus Methylospira mobilis]
MQPETAALFISERRGVLSRKTVWALMRRYSDAAGLGILLQHAAPRLRLCAGRPGRADTRLIRDYLGHRNIQHTVRYTATNPARFRSCGGSLVFSIVVSERKSHMPHSVWPATFFQARRFSKKQDYTPLI